MSCILYWIVQEFLKSLLWQLCQFGSQDQDNPIPSLDCWELVLYKTPFPGDSHQPDMLGLDAGFPAAPVRPLQWFDGSAWRQADASNNSQRWNWRLFSLEEVKIRSSSRSETKRTLSRSQKYWENKAIPDGRVAPHHLLGFRLDHMVWFKRTEKMGFSEGMMVGLCSGRSTYTTLARRSIRSVQK